MIEVLPIDTDFIFIVGLRFEEIKDVEAWHESVRLFSVRDISSSELLGYFYLDLFSRSISSSFLHFFLLFDLILLL